MINGNAEKLEVETISSFIPNTDASYGMEFNDYSLDSQVGNDLVKTNGSRGQVSWEFSPQLNVERSERDLNYLNLEKDRVKDHDIVSSSWKQEAVFLLEDRRFYIYVYLDPRKPGIYKYGEYQFDYEPYYIGKGKERRLFEHLKIASSRNSINPLFYNKILKIKESFEIKNFIDLFYINLTEPESFGLEMLLIDLIGRIDLEKGPLCNLTIGGPNFKGICNPKYNKGHTITGEQNPFYGKTVSQETRDYFSRLYTGKKMSQEFKENCSKRMLGNQFRLGKKHTEERKQQISEQMKGNQWNVGKTQSEESNKKRSLKLKGRYVSEETRKKRSECMKKTLALKKLNKNTVSI